MEENLQEFESEIKKEFQLERMILFSDAVFAIVITLMAIEIHMPEFEKKPTQQEFLHSLLHVLPTILAYAISFFFIGMIWYRHLKLFSFLKTYDGGLVARNLFLLFCVGLFPFGASLIANRIGLNAPFIIYLVIVILCLSAQIALQHYIFIKKPSLRNSKPIRSALTELKLMKVTVSLFATAIILYYITYSAIINPQDKQFAVFWIFPVAFIIRFLRNKYKREGKLPNED
ncbi:MAG: hypothetical protein K0S09_3116 [Sphingobacteriaceae bacterium]|jgi:uncharacterized membrane protein|nr:hypothetical protein [Sphingobacteriaceae bacterium]